MVCGAPSVMSTTEPKMLELPADNWVMIGKVSICVLFVSKGTSFKMLLHYSFRSSWARHL